MPELITHYLVGEKVIGKIKDKDIKSLLEVNKKEFLLGCQGGDLFFFFNYGLFKDKKHIPEFGERLHVEKVEQFFEEGLTYIKDHYSEKLFAYFLGYLCHYGTDKAVHPFVYQKSKNTTTMHHNIEFMLGKQYLMDTEGKDTSDFDMSEPFEFTMAEEILDFYHYIAETLYGQNLDKNDIRKSKQDFKTFKLRTQKPNKQYKLLAKLAKPVVKFDPMALVYKDENKWEFFTQEEYAGFVSSLVNAIDYSIKVIKAADGYVNRKRKIDKYLNFFDGTNFNGQKS